MTSPRIVRTLAVVTLVAGCGGGAPAAETPEAESPPSSEPATAQATDAERDAPAESAESSDAAAAAEEESGTLPRKCHASSPDGMCLPPPAFVQRLCSEGYPNIALVMHSKGAPWTKGYLTRKTKAWNASGGASGEGFLAFDEEVVLLRSRQPEGGMQVSGAGGYDALRWDGSCVTLANEEVTVKRPPKPKSSKVFWQDLWSSMKEALKRDDAVRAAYIKRKKECKGVNVGAVSKKCEVADEALTEAIIARVRSAPLEVELERVP